MNVPAVEIPANAKDLSLSFFRYNAAPPTATPTTVEMIALVLFDMPGFSGFLLLV